MRTKKIISQSQAQLALSKNGVWRQLPEPTRQQCRRLLIQLIQHVVQATPERSNDERQD